MLNINGALLKIFIVTLLFLVQRVASDVSISKPLTGQTYEVSGSSVSVNVAWEDSNATPKLSTIESYTFTLCSGPNSDIYAVKVLKKVSADAVSGHSITLDIDASSGADGEYYIQIYAAVSEGYTIHYSNRFTLDGMTGTYKPSVGSVTAPPSGQTSIANDGATAVASINSASFSVTYTLQTGLTRFAPMQMQPGSVLTKNKSSWSRQNPTSSVSFYTTVRPSPAQSSTITPGYSYTRSSAVNYASPAPNPSIAGWYNPSSVLTKPTISIPSGLVKNTSKA